MKRRFNISIWAGFLIILAALFTFVPVFVRFPATRDIPWATFLISFAGLALMIRGLLRAYRSPGEYRGKVAGPILTTLGVGLIAFFAYGVLYVPTQIPASEGAPRPGRKAPDFRLPDQDGQPIALSDLLAPAALGGFKLEGTLLIFYRGWW
jgi:hypothetical protein